MGPAWPRILGDHHRGDPHFGHATGGRLVVFFWRFVHIQPQRKHLNACCVVIALDGITSSKLDVSFIFIRYMWPIGPSFR